MAQYDTYIPDYPPLPILERVRFAWWPVTLSDGTRCFLQRYRSVEQYHPARFEEPWGAVGDGWTVMARHRLQPAPRHEVTIDVGLERRIPGCEEMEPVRVPERGVAGHEGVPLSSRPVGEGRVAVRDDPIEVR